MRRELLAIGILGAAGALLFSQYASATAGPELLSADLNDAPPAMDPAPSFFDGGTWISPAATYDEVSIVNADQNVSAFLAMIRAAEGTAGPDGYQALFGYRPGNGKLFYSFEDHPRQVFSFTQTNGKVNRTSAAGAYQITAPTWDSYKQAAGVSDFTPESQDTFAVYLIERKSALEDVQAGRFDLAVSKVAAVWASLPGSPYPQHTRSQDFVRQAFVSAGGSYA